MYKDFRLYKDNIDSGERYNGSIPIYTIDKIEGINIIRTREIMRDIDEEIIAEQGKRYKCVEIPVINFRFSQFEMVSRYRGATFRNN